MTLDYIFYRIYTAYKNKKDSTPIFMACSVLALCTSCSILDAYVLLGLLIRVDLPVNKIVIAFISLGSLYLYFNHYKSAELVAELIERFKDENLHTRIARGYIIVTSIILLLLIPLLKGFIQHNLGIDIYS